MARDRQKSSGTLKRMDVLSFFLFLMVAACGFVCIFTFSTGINYYDIWDYYEAGDVLCNIYNDYYKNPEQSVKIMEEVYQTIALNTDSSIFAAIPMILVRTIFLVLSIFDASHKKLNY